MKKILIHTIPVLISLIWITIFHHTYQPISLKGPHFLTFYLMLLIGFYLSIFVSKSIKVFDFKLIVVFMVSIIILGIIKLFRGIALHKPIGFLIIILFFELIITLIFIIFQQNRVLNSHKK